MRVEEFQSLRTSVRGGEGQNEERERERESERETRPHLLPGMSLTLTENCSS